MVALGLGESHLAVIYQVWVQAERVFSDIQHHPRTEFDAQRQILLSNLQRIVDILPMPCLSLAMVH